MSEAPIKTLEASNGRARVHIARRADGAFAFRTQNQYRDGWRSMGLDAGVYDSAETAEREARVRVWRLAAGSS